MSKLESQGEYRLIDTLEQCMRKPIALYWHFWIADGATKFEEKKQKSTNPLDVFYDGLTLRQLIDIDEQYRREFAPRKPFTPAQTKALSAHWSRELRKRT